MTDQIEEGGFHLLEAAVKENGTVLVGIGREWSDAKTEETLRDAYGALAKLLRWSNYFIVTMNTDDRIYAAELDARHIVAPFGSIHRFQCEDGCEGKIWTEQEVPGDLVCPFCGKRLIANTKEAANYLESGYLPQWQAYTEWLTHTLNQKLTILELGVGFEMPTVVRWPFERIAFLNQKAKLYRVNEKWHQLSEELCESGRAFSLKCSSCELFAAAAGEQNRDKNRGERDGSNQ